MSAQLEPDTILLERDGMGQLVLKESTCGNKWHRVVMSGEMSNIKCVRLQRIVRIINNDECYSVNKNKFFEIVFFKIIDY